MLGPITRSAVKLNNQQWEKSVCLFIHSYEICRTKGTVKNQVFHGTLGLAMAVLQWLRIDIGRREVGLASQLRVEGARVGASTSLRSGWRGRDDPCLDTPSTQGVPLCTDVCHVGINCFGAQASKSDMSTRGGYPRNVTAVGTGRPSGSSDDS